MVHARCQTENDKRHKQGKKISLTMSSPNNFHHERSEMKMVNLNIIIRNALAMFNGIIKSKIFLNVQESQIGRPDCFVTFKVKFVFNINIKEIHRTEDTKGVLNHISRRQRHGKKRKTLKQKQQSTKT